MVQTLFERGSFGPTATDLCAGLLPYAAIGLVWGLVLKIRRPKVYAAIGLGAHAITGQLTPAREGTQ